MCSGCAGDYEGDFEFEHGAGPGCSADDGHRAAWPCGGFDEPAPELDANGAGGFEAEEHSESNPQSRSGRWGRGARSSEICEITVSATRIIEIRVITAEGVENTDSHRDGGAEMPPARKHSWRASAKYYRTRGRDASAGCGDGRETLWLCRMTALAARGFKAWARWAHGALRW